MCAQFPNPFKLNLRKLSLLPQVSVKRSLSMEWAVSLIPLFVYHKLYNIYSEGEGEGERMFVYIISCHYWKSNKSSDFLGQDWKEIVTPLSMTPFYVTTVIL